MIYQNLIDKGIQGRYICKKKISVKKCPNWKGPGKAGKTAMFYQAFKEILVPVLFKLVHKVQNKKDPNKCFWWSQYNADAQPREGYIFQQESYLPISLMDTDTNIFDETAANQIAEHKKKYSIV